MKPAINFDFTDILESNSLEIHNGEKMWRN